MDVLMKTLQGIYDECSSEKDKGRSNDADDKEAADPFTSKKKHIAAQLRDIRLMIKERDQTEKDQPQSTHGVQLSSNIRKALAAVTSEADALKQDEAKQQAKYQKKIEKGGKPNKEIEQQFSLRGDVLEVITRHIEEVESLNLRRGAATAMTKASQQQSDPTVSAIPDIDDPRFQLLIKNDAEIDELIDRIEEKVDVLKRMATDMHVELEVQGEMLETIDHTVTKDLKQLENLNKRLKKLVKQLRSGDKFCVDFLLVCVLLGVAGLIFNLVRSRL